MADYHHRSEATVPSFSRPLSCTPSEDEVQTTAARRATVGSQTKCKTKPKTPGSVRSLRPSFFKRRRRARLFIQLALLAARCVSWCASSFHDQAPPFCPVRPRVVLSAKKKKKRFSMGLLERSVANEIFQPFLAFEETLFS